MVLSFCKRIFLSSDYLLASSEGANSNSLMRGLANLRQNFRPEKKACLSTTALLLLLVSLFIDRS